MDHAYSYIEKYGIETEKDYPYKAVSEKCQYSEDKEIFKATSFTDVP